VLSGPVLMAANDFKRQGDRPSRRDFTAKIKLLCQDSDPALPAESLLAIDFG